MREFTILRAPKSPDGTFGIFIDGDQPFALTVEPEWRDNKSDISCVPPGRYRCERVQSSKWGNTFTICDVPERTVCRFHWGNDEDDTEGCVCVAEQFGELNGKTAVLRSNHPGHGFQEFLARTKDIDEFMLNILPPPDWELQQHEAA